MKLIKFGASWCGPCRIMNERLKSFTTCEVQYIDVDDESQEVQDLIEEYQIMNVPVMILLDDEGNLVNKWIGLTDIKEIEKYCV
jgi:thiol-disulfide isomerase/thioredoxin